MDKSRLEAFSDGIIAYLVLQQFIIASQGTEFLLKKAVGDDYKGKLSPVLYLDRHCRGVLVSMDIPSSIRTGDAGLARARSTHRERTYQQRNITCQTV